MDKQSNKKEWCTLTANTIHNKHISFTAYIPHLQKEKKIPHSGWHKIDIISKISASRRQFNRLWDKAIETSQSQLTSQHLVRHMKFSSAHSYFQKTKLREQNLFQFCLFHYAVPQKRICGFIKINFELHKAKQTIKEVPHLSTKLRKRKILALMATVCYSLWNS